MWLRCFQFLQVEYFYLSENDHTSLILNKMLHKMQSVTVWNFDNMSQNCIVMLYSIYKVLGTKNWYDKTKEIHEQAYENIYWTKRETHIDFNGKFNDHKNCPKKLFGMD